MSNHTPTAEDLVTVFGRDGIGQPHAANTARARRAVRKIEADALRNAAKTMRGHVTRARPGERFTEHELVEHDVEHVLNEYADRIENGEQDT